MGDVLLQKTFTPDILTKKKKKNNGELTQYYITDNHPAIIGREDFLQTQAELTRRAGKKKVSKKKTKSALGKYCSKYALSERLVCGECGSMYRRVMWTRKDGKKPMWRCINRLEFGTQYCKHSPSLPEGPLHQAILACIQKVAGNREDILQSLREVRDNLLAFPDTNASTFSLQQKIDQLQQEMAALVKIMAQGGDSQFYAAKLRELSEQKVKLARQLQESQQQQQEGKIRAYQEQQALIVLSNEDSLDLTEFHEDFIRRVIEQVTVLSKDRILVRFVGGFEVEGKIPQGN